MIPTWSTFINYGRGWQHVMTLYASDFPTRKSAEAYMKDYAIGLQKQNELEYTPRTAVVPDLKEE